MVISHSYVSLPEGTLYIELCLHPNSCHLVLIFGFVIILLRNGKLRFSWKGDGKPEKVDWEGQRNQFDCAVEEGLQQVVPRPIFSSIVGTVICWCLKIGGAHTVAIWIRKGQNISKYDTAWYCIVFWGCPFSRQTDKLLDRLTDIRVFSVGELGAHFVARSHSSWHPQRRVGVTSK